MTDAVQIPASRRPRMRPIKAAAALIRTLRNKEDTASVFQFQRYLDAPVAVRRAAAFAASPVGARVIAERRDLQKTLSDHAALESLPANSLGRAYLAFVRRENISANGLQAEAEAAGIQDRGDTTSAYGRRITHTHDLFHIVTGYGRDFVGEIALLAFTREQIGSRALVVLSAFAAMKAMRDYPGLPVWACRREGARLGRRAGALLHADWEALLAQPLSEVRRDLNIGVPKRYLAVKAGAEAIDLRYREQLASV